MNVERRAGFTLLEVMVALVIVALGMMAVNSQINRYTQAAIHIEEKTLASWIATNLITERSVAPVWPELGDSDEEIEFAGRRWSAHIEVAETPVDNLRRVDVEMALADDPERIVHKASGILEPPPPGGFTPVSWSLPGEGGARGGDGRRGAGEGDEGESDGAEGSEGQRGEGGFGQPAPSFGGGQRG